MELTEEQKGSVRAWAGDGLGLSEIQKQISEEFGISMTYMDVRFLVLDLGAELQDKETTEPVDLSAPAEVPEAEDTLVADEDAGELAGPASNGVSVELDRITKPGSVISGTVQFSDGTSASWFMDQMGRLSLDAGTPGYQPSEADVQSFQLELRKVLEKRGF